MKRNSLSRCISHGACRISSRGNIKAESGAMVASSPTIDIESKMEGGFLGALSRKVLSGEKFFFQTLRAAAVPAKSCWLRRCREISLSWNSMV